MDIMLQTKVADMVQSILIHHFGISRDQFSWDAPLESLQPDFKVLNQLMFFEQLLQQKYGKKVQLLENISTAFHTPRDIVDLIDSR